MRWTSKSLDRDTVLAFPLQIFNSLLVGVRLDSSLGSMMVVSIGLVGVWLGVWLALSSIHVHVVRHDPDTPAVSHIMSKRRWLGRPAMPRSRRDRIEFGLFPILSVN